MWKNIQAGQAWAAEHAAEDDAAAALCSDYPRAGRNLTDLCLHPRERIRWREAALAAARRLKLRDAEGMHLHSLGSAYLDLGQPHRAIEFCERALTILREVGDRRGEGNALGNPSTLLRAGLGMAYADLGEPRRAIELHEQALAIFRDIGDRRGEGDGLRHLGLAHDLLGEPHRAIRFYEQALAIFREVGDSRREGNALWNLSQSLDKLGDRAQAVAHAQVALKIFEAIENPNAAEVREQLARWCGQEQPKDRLRFGE